MENKDNNPKNEDIDFNVEEVEEVIAPNVYGDGGDDLGDGSGGTDAGFAISKHCTNGSVFVCCC